jgi:transmembrane sensor
MANREKFTHLLNTYLAGNITDDEYRELMGLIKSGGFDDLLRQKIDHAFAKSNATHDIDEDRARELLFNILTSEKQTAELIAIKRPMQKKWVWAAAAAAIIIFVAGFQLLKPKNENRAFIAKKETKILQPAIGLKTEKYIRLADGSTVLLNEGSRLDYPENFGSSTREVTLIGEGYFDIQHETGRPFIVHTGKITTTVLGTAFNIKAYPHQTEIIVTVTRGKVKVSDDKRILGVLRPNESIAVNTENNLFRQQKVNAADTVEWKKQYLVFEDITMQDAAVLIAARYNVHISFSKESLKDCIISATFLDNENLEQVLTVVTGVVNARYTTQPNDQIIISGEGCN